MSSGGQRIGDFIDDHSIFTEEPECVHFITMIRVFGAENTMKWNVARKDNAKAEHSVVTWVASSNDFPRQDGTVPNASLDADDNSKICFKKAGYYCQTEEELYIWV